jgi:hypothetical protein
LCKRRPGVLLLVRLIFFGGLFLGVAGVAILNGRVDISKRGCRARRPGCDDDLYFADHPMLVTIVIATLIASALFMIAVSILDYRKQRKRLSNHPKIVGLDAR